MTWRTAVPADAEALADLEQAANEKSLAHIFAGHPFPWDVVVANWRTRLGASDHVVEVVDGRGRLSAFCCWSAERLEHLAVHPSERGRGLAKEGISRAAAAIGASGREPVLWCLADNAVARAMYEHLGWMLTGRTTRCQYPPFHEEVEYVLRWAHDGV
ncbi:MAG: GNAT family N-acetyltransferase [Actinomycetes bacterium]